MQPYETQQAFRLSSLSKISKPNLKKLLLFVSCTVSDILPLPFYSQIILFMVCPSERHKLEREKQKLGESYFCFSSLKHCVQPENVKDVVTVWGNNPWVGEQRFRAERLLVQFYANLEREDSVKFSRTFNQLRMLGCEP